ncbi:MAG: MATE family efflux transporter [Alphaproteobacteria bacterium]|nr:MATE family efflux transporter [Alphaproteobacteria bacterium]MCW5741983.1 MATE family efflux transporter [Alphaproteobacteria bacterium]
MPDSAPILRELPAPPKPHPLLEAPPVPIIARLALPTTAVMIAQSGVSVAETWVIGQLGTEALAGFALVFPLLMLMTMMAAGGIGGGIASAIARASGGGRTAEVRALVVHALVVALGFALLFTIGMRVFGADIYRLLGSLRSANGAGAGGDPALVLAYALTYSDMVFAGAAAHWAMFALSSIIRGAGNAALPGKAMLLSSLLQIPLTYVLALGVGGWGGMGIAGAAVSSILTALLAAGLMARSLHRGAAGIAPSLRGISLRGSLFAPILRVGLISSISAIIANLTTILVTLLVAGFGVAALAGYGVGSRLEFMLVPLAFGIGSALTTLVGIAVGAGQWERAVRVAVIGSLMAAALTGVVGVLAAIFPQGWMSIFSADAAVQQTGVAYLTRAAPFYAFFGLGMALNFAAQGAGRQGVPLAIAFLRLALAAGGGWLAVHVWGLGQDGLFWAVAIAIVVFGSANLVALLVRPWRGR